MALSPENPIPHSPEEGRKLTFLNPGVQQFVFRNLLGLEYRSKPDGRYTVIEARKREGLLRRYHEIIRIDPIMPLGFHNLALAHVVGRCQGEGLIDYRDTPKYLAEMERVFSDQREQ